MENETDFFLKRRLKLQCWVAREKRKTQKRANLNEWIYGSA